ncbi:MAG: CinA family nicotinamide mononucleotide deamidase-related protein, partial [Clostridium sp.]
MIVELISVGTELLLGNIVNTNARYLSEKCALLGASIYYQTTVGDNKERLSEVIKTAISRSDVIILNGGLGPTEDDITKEVCAEVMGAALVDDASVRTHLEEWYKLRGKTDIPESNWKQALVPEGAVVLPNDNGTAPGLILEKDGKTAILLPGPPNELYPMVENQVSPYIMSKQSSAIRSQMVKICGYGESKVEEMLLDLIEGQSNPTLATYAKTKEVHLRVTARAETDEEARKLLKPVVKEIKKRFGNAVYTTDENESLEEVV